MSHVYSQTKMAGVLSRTENLYLVNIFQDPDQPARDKEKISMLLYSDNKNTCDIPFIALSILAVPYFKFWESRTTEVPAKFELCACQSSTKGYVNPSNELLLFALCSQLNIQLKLYC